MSRLLLVLAPVLLAVFVEAPAAPVPKHLMKPPVYYFPTKVGTKLEYAIEGRSSRTWVVQKVTERGGAKVIEIDSVTADGGFLHSESFAVSGVGLYRIEHEGHQFDPPEAWLLFPPDRGRTWEFALDDPLRKPRLRAQLRIADSKDVTVPAGTFRCVSVVFTSDSHSSTTWFAPEVGVVKTEAPTWNSVLNSYTPAKE